MDIKEVLQKSGLTVGKFADSLYVSSRTVHNWLSGSTKIPRQKQKQILDIYGERKLSTQTGEIDPD